LLDPPVAVTNAPVRAALELRLPWGIHVGTVVEKPYVDIAILLSSSAFVVPYRYRDSARYCYRTRQLNS
jgi:hypothetical protein